MPKGDVRGGKFEGHAGLDWFTPERFQGAERLVTTGPALHSLGEGTTHATLPGAYAGHLRGSCRVLVSFCTGVVPTFPTHNAGSIIPAEVEGLNAGLGLPMIGSACINGPFLWQRQDVRTGRQRAKWCAEGRQRDVCPILI